MHKSLATRWSLRQYGICIVKNNIRNCYTSGERDAHHHHMYKKRFGMHGRRFGVSKKWKKRSETTWNNRNNEVVSSGTRVMKHTGSCSIVEHVM